MILFLSLAKIFSLKLVIAWILKLIHDVFILAMPFLLKILMQVINSEKYVDWMGYGLALIFLLTGIIGSIFENLSYFMTSYLSIRVRGVIIGMIYRKTLRLNNGVRNRFTTGEIVNLMSVDAERIMLCVDISWFIFSCPFHIILATILLYQELKFAAFAGIALILIFLPLNGILMEYIQNISDIELKFKDERIKILAEILKGIKVLKMYTWEKSFLSKITNIRNHEIKFILKSSIGWGLVSIIWETLPFLITLVTFWLYLFIDKMNIITAEKAFVSLALFNFMKFPMIILPLGITQTVNSFVSLKRIAKYLVEEEINKLGVDHTQTNLNFDDDENVVIEINGGSFSWGNNEKYVLNNIDLAIERGKLIAVVGKVGTGKSSLISAILGEMKKLTGLVKIHGKIAYVSQEAWIQNKSLKDNILFTATYDEIFYKNVVESCCLTLDFEQLPAGDETEIGERGINLSGGQKQRVNLARAVYQNRDIYLLDDPLSAVDAHVGQYLFEHVISHNGILKEKTRVFVTNGLNWLSMVDEVFMLNSNGCISEKGSFKELLENGKEFQQFVEENMVNFMKTIKFADSFQETIESEKTEQLLNPSLETGEDIDELTDLNLSDQQKSVTGNETADKETHHVPSITVNDVNLEQSVIPEDIDADLLVENKDFISNSATEVQREIIIPLGKLIDDEITLSGTVKCGIYLIYAKSRGLILFIVTILLYAGFIGLQVFSNLWIERFTEDKIIFNASNLVHKNISNLMEQSRIIRERSEFFIIRYSLIGLAMIGMISLFWFGFTIGNYKSVKYIHKKLLNCIFRCPMEFFDTTPTGRILNRFSKDLDLLDHTMHININDALSCIFMVIASITVILYVTPWFIFVIIPLIFLYYLIQHLYMPTSRQSRRLDSIASSPVFSHFMETVQGVSIIRAFNSELYFLDLNHHLIDRSSRFKFIQFSSVRWLCLRIDIIGSLIVFFTVIFAVANSSYLTAGLIGLSISYALQITEALNWFMRQYTDIETNMVALERINEYTLISSEAEWNSINPPPTSWPSAGNINFYDYDMRYRDGLPLVLKNINLYLDGGYRIGVVGRTGSGKSSLTAAMFRLVEAAHGKIVIDDYDISRIGLHDLRKILTILPQDPVIFSGTLRENLDPFGIYSDDELFQSLETSHLKEWVLTLQRGIDYECGEGGANLSAGQKQLLCLARALLRKSKILILDEATASVDFETDKLVMNTIRDHFKKCTVIIIAHRINTILDADKIVVIENGEIVETDSPKNLLEITDGVFKSLCNQNEENKL